MDLSRSFRTGKWRSASTERLLGLLPEHGKPDCISGNAKDNNTISNELSEDDVLWLDDLILTKRRANNSRSVPHSSKAPPALLHRNMLFVRRSESFGVFGVLQERRARPVFDHKLTTNVGSATASSRMIPKVHPNEKPSSSFGRYRRSSSIPVNVPVNLPTSANKRHQWEFDDINDDEADDGREMVPPHEMLARSEMATFSVLEGAGRTLKGRDLRQVRNAVFRHTGFID